MEKHPFDEFGMHVFSESVMKDRLPSPVFKKWKTSVSKEDSLDRATADAIAHAMKSWAIDLGATHFSHWFQPLTGQTAEKHDSFLEPGDSGAPIARFSGKMLIKGETDGSSFPSGGLRATFEARGYTYWDCTSPAFIRDNVLCIPTVFVSYNGEPLDQKAPLLKAIEALSIQATRITNALGDKTVKRVNLLVGLEQEYFLVDLEMFNKRPDLLFCGRTLLGAMPSKGQELEDHYFGSISARVKAFMDEVNLELWRVGIFARIEHNEVAPGQFELCPIFADANVAVDQNQIIMDVLKKVAKKHGMACLLHEKPFKGINGSGKHNNWSLVTDDGQNLFEPGDKPHENVRFLMFVCAVIKAIDQYPELLRLAASGPGNDHRLGANEAPPAVISVFMGTVIEDILMKLINKETFITAKDTIKFSPISTLSYIPKDNSDRNRTSPFAFTGNKFEFRMLGSSRSAATVNTVISTTIADVLRDIADRLEPFKYLQETREAALEICVEILRDHHRILFSGDGYSEAWLVEAEKRGLPNIRSFVESIDSLIEEKSINLFARTHVYTENELHARSEVMHDQYVKVISMEAKTLIDLVDRMIVPSLVDELKELGPIVSKSKVLANKEKVLVELLDKVDELSAKLKGNVATASEISDIRLEGTYLLKNVVPLMEEVRSYADKIEIALPAKSYPLPDYKDLLFLLD